MLDQHLIAKTAPRALYENIVLWDSYRVTVLQNRLFRVEHSKEHLFRDDATQSVWFRNMPEQHFEKECLGDSELVIRTDACELHLRKRIKDCFVVLDGTKLNLANKDNLKGTYRTLDCYDGDTFIFRKEGEPEKKVDLGTGVCSKSGLAVFDDAKSLSLLQNGEISSTCGDGEDLYVFVYGHDYRAAVQALYMICGPTPLIPRYALGNWWSRYHAYEDREYLRLLSRFEENDVPLTIATVDMDWHYSDKEEMESLFHVTENGLNFPEYVGKSSLGWTGYTWNKRLFPDYKAFLKRIKDKHMHITLNVHPADGVRYFEDAYEDMCQATGVDPASKKMVPFHISDPNFVNHYFSILHKPYERDGVDFWWLDWQQGEASEMAGLDPLWALNHYHYLDNAKGHPIPLILSRYAGIGSHRYPLGFSGDTIVSWKTLSYLPYFTSTASNVGYSWWSHDIGGHMSGISSQDLFTRHLQFGVFSPINRLHSTAINVFTKEPWYYGNGAGEIMMKWLRFRHALIPFLYSASEKTHREGAALIEPLYYEWDQPQAYEMDDEYYFGRSLLVAPVTTPLAEDGYSRTTVWLPEGTWYDIFKGDRYVVSKEGKTFTTLRDLTSIPVFAKAGSVLPLSGDHGNSTSNPQKMDLWVFNGTSSFSLFEDGSNEGKKGSCVTTYTTEYSEQDGVCQQKVTISSKGDQGVIPKNREYEVIFKNIVDGTVELTCDGKPVKVKDLCASTCHVRFAFKVGHEYVLMVTFKKLTEFEEFFEHAHEVLLYAEAEVNRKHKLLRQIENADSLENAFELVRQSEDVPECVKERLLESYFA